MIILRARKGYTRDEEGKFARVGLPPGVDPRSDKGKAIYMARKSTSLRIKIHRTKDKDPERAKKLEKARGVLNAKIKKINEKLRESDGVYIDAGGKVKEVKGKGKPKEKPKPEEPEQPVHPKSTGLGPRPKTGLGSKESMAQWDKAETTKEIVALARKKFPNIKFKIPLKFDASLMRDSLKTLESLSVDFPGPFSMITEVSNSKATWGTVAKARRSWSKKNQRVETKIMLTDMYYTDRSKYDGMMVRNRVSGYLYAGKDGTGGNVTMNHEFGHIVDFYYRHDRGRIFKASDMKSSPGQKFPTASAIAMKYSAHKTPTATWARLTQYHLIKNQASSSPNYKVSGYAMNDDYETFAESFAAMRAGDFKSRPARQLGVLLDGLDSMNKTQGNLADRIHNRFSLVADKDLDDLYKKVEGIK